MLKSTQLCFRMLTCRLWLAVHKFSSFICSEWIKNISWDSSGWFLTASLSRMFKIALRFYDFHFKHLCKSATFNDALIFISLRSLASLIFFPLSLSRLLESFNLVISKIFICHYLKENLFSYIFCPKSLLDFNYILFELIFLLVAEKLWKF